MGPKVGLYFWIRIVVMITTLVGVMIVMNRLRNSNTMSSKPIESLNICPTRVSSVSKIGSFAILQDGMTWYRTDDAGRTEMGQIAVEKWFSEYCDLPIEPVDSNEGAAPLLTIAYVSGLPKTLLMSPDGIFTLEGVHFRSLKLGEGIAALENLPLASKPGQMGKDAPAVLPMNPPAPTDP